MELASCAARFASPSFASAATFAWSRCVEAAWVRCYFSFWRAVCWKAQRFQTQWHVTLAVHFFEGCESKLFDKEWFFCIAIRRGSREVNILQVELAALLVLQAPALLLLPPSHGRAVSGPHGPGVTLVSGEQFAAKLNDSKLSDMSHWRSIFWGLRI